MSEAITATGEALFNAFMAGADEVDPETPKPTWDDLYEGEQRAWNKLAEKLRGE